MDQVRWVMEQVEAGEESLATLQDKISALHMTANYRAFGNLCGRECMMLTLHHDIENESMFPALHQRSDGLDKVVDRLKEEHLVIHHLLQTLEQRAIGAIREPGEQTFAELKAAFLTLDRVVRSHFGYEQEELEEALGYYAVPL
jgi:Hemerythrin HHE cation binding domain